MVCFNSLQTGKHIQRQAKLDALRGDDEGFNSLQTGKHIQSIRTQSNPAVENRFQFPSNGKAYPKRIAVEVDSADNGIGFNSLQTGKHIQRHIKPIDLSKTNRPFQFPSNGKAYPK